MDVILHEVGPRDGLQVESAIVPTAQKIAWIEHLIAAGLDLVQVGSFVNPKMVPQMADTDQVCRHFADERYRPARTRLTALVLNEKGLERGLASGVDYFCMGVSASDTHSRRNTGMSGDEAAQRILATARAARASGATVQLSVQSAFGCGYEGPVSEPRVLDLVARFVDAGFTIVSLADTAGHATPPQVRRLFEAIRRGWPEVACACHLHDTFGLAMANACAAMEAGVLYFETSFAGLGGCPFTAIAGGNLCTEDYVHLLQRLGLRRDLSLDALIDVAKDAEAFFERALPGVIHRTGPIRHEQAVTP